MLRLSLYHTYEKILDCLLDSDTGRTKWGITQEVINVDYRRMQKILDKLEKSKNIDYDKGFMRYIISDKGRKTLEVIRHFNKKYGFLVSPEVEKSK